MERTSTPEKKCFQIWQENFEPKRGSRNEKSQGIPAAGCEDLFHETDEVADRNTAPDSEMLNCRSTRRSFAHLLIRSTQGFTLLEVLIATAILVVAFAAVIMSQSSSVNSSIKAKHLNTASMLARNKMIETEQLIEGQAFDSMKKEEEGKFPAPYEDYAWKCEIKEVHFPDLVGSAGGGDSSESGSSGGGGPLAEQVGQMVTKFLSDSLREITVTVSWDRGSGKQKLSVSTYWVNLNNEFKLN